MPRKKKSKSDLIRATLAELGPEARNRDIIAKLAEEKVTVSAQMVSTVRSRMSGGSLPTNGAKRPGRPGRRPVPTSVSFAALLNAKRLVAEAGSVEAAQQTLAALAQLV